MYKMLIHHLTTKDYGDSFEERAALVTISNVLYNDEEEIMVLEDVNHEDRFCKKVPYWDYFNLVTAICNFSDKHPGKIMDCRRMGPFAVRDKNIDTANLMSSWYKALAMSVCEGGTVSDHMIAEIPFT